VRWKLVLLLALLLSAAGCATFPEPNQGSQTLVIGVAQYDGQSMPWTFVNGIHRSGLKLSMTNMDSHQTIVVATDLNGQFASAEFAPGRYTVQQMFVKITEGGGWYQSYFRPGRYGYHFVVSEGKVNNLGVLKWTETYTGFLGNGRVGGDTRAEKFSTSSQLRVGTLYEDVQTGLAKTQPKSAWHEREWVSAAFD
jgi:hypothetical protein